MASGQDLRRARCDLDVDRLAQVYRRVVGEGRRDPGVPPILTMVTNAQQQMMRPIHQHPSARSIQVRMTPRAERQTRLDIE